MEFLKDLNPNTLVVVGILVILREIFAFVGKIAKSRSPNCQATGMNSAMEKVAEHIEAQTDLIKNLTYEVKSINEAVFNVRRGMEKIESEVRRIQ